MSEVKNNSDRKRLEIWEYFGGFCIIAGLIIVIAIAVTVNNHLEAEIKKAKEIAEANRPVDAVNAGLVKLETTEIVDSINLPGLLQAWNKSNLSAQVSGKLIKKVKEGTEVKKGEPILYLDPSDYKIKLVEAKSTFEEAKQNYERKKRLRSSRVNALSELEAATATFNQAKSDYEAAELALQRCTIRSPFDGVVDTVQPEIGELVNNGDNVATIAQLGELKVEIGIPEKDIDLVRNVKECEVSVEAAGVTATGKRTYLSYLPANDSQVYILRLKLPNKDGKLRPGMFGNVKVVRDIRKGFRIPIYSVLAKDNKHYVFIAEKYTPASGRKDPRDLKTAKKKLVKLGVIQGTNIEITKGLEADEKLVVVGQRNLDDGTIINVTHNFRSMSELNQ